MAKYYYKNFDDDVDQSKVKPNYRDFAKRIHDTMRDMHIAVEDLAVRTGIPQNSLSYYRTGQQFPRDPQAITKIAECLEVTSDYLLGGTPVRTADPDFRMIAKCTGLSDRAILLLNKATFISDAINELCDGGDASTLVLFCKSLSDEKTEVQKVRNRLQAGDRNYDELKKELAVVAYNFNQNCQKLDAATELMKEIDGLGTKELIEALAERRRETTHGE